MNKIKCCNKTLHPQKGKSETKGAYIFFRCSECGRSGIGQTEEQAITDFNKNIPTAIKTLAPLSNRQGLIQWAEKNMPVLLNQAAQFIDKPATKKMIEKNIRYVANLSGYSWDKIWKTPEGQESIIDAFSDSLYNAATLPEMGSIVPFGTTAEFIPAVECFEFALTTGKNAPFENINMTPIHENDQQNNDQKDGNFMFELNRGVPRGDVIAIAVYGTRTDVNKVIGEIYDEPFLMEKAKDHSPGYRAYLIEKEDFQRMKVEGKLKKDGAGREYMENKIKKKDGSIWDKKVYEYEITNPYASSDKVKMLIKSAGKSFFNKYMKVRNAIAVADEWNGDDIDGEVSRNEAADNVLSNAQKQFNNTGDIKDAEIIPDTDTKNNKEKGGEEEKDLKNNEGELFNDTDINNL